VVWRQSTLLAGTEVILRFPVPAATATSADVAPCHIPADSGDFAALNPSIQKHPVKRSHSAYKWGSATNGKEGSR